MKILVCLSTVPDTTTKFQLTADKSKVDLKNIQWIINPWDELALTRALELRDECPGRIESVAVAAVGKAAEPTLRKALAIGADRGLRVDADPIDSYQAAANLAEIVKKEPHDIVLCGIDSSDYNGSAVGGMLAELLGFPSVSSVAALDLKDGEALVKREIDGGYELVSTRLPAVLIVQKGIAREPRIPSMRGVMQARSKPIALVPPAGAAAHTEIIGCELPPARPACKKIGPDNMQELVRLLHEEAKVL